MPVEGRGGGWAPPLGSCLLQAKLKTKSFKEGPILPVLTDKAGRPSTRRHQRGNANLAQTEGPEVPPPTPSELSEEISSADQQENVSGNREFGFSLDSNECQIL